MTRSEVHLPAQAGSVHLDAIPDETLPVITLVYLAPVYVDSAAYQFALGMWEWGLN